MTLRGRVGGRSTVRGEGESQARGGEGLRVPTHWTGPAPTATLAHWHPPLSLCLSPARGGLAARAQDGAPPGAGALPGLCWGCRSLAISCSPFPPRPPARAGGTGCHLGHSSPKQASRRNELHMGSDAAAISRAPRSQLLLTRLTGRSLWTRGAGVRGSRGLGWGPSTGSSSGSVSAASLGPSPCVPSPGLAGPAPVGTPLPAAGWVLAEAGSRRHTFHPPGPRSPCPGSNPRGSRRSCWGPSPAARPGSWVPLQPLEPPP